MDYRGLKMDRFLYGNEERYHNLLDSAPHLIASINEDGQIIDCNDKISEVLGYKQSEVIGHSMLDFIHPNYHGKAVESWNGGYLKDFKNKETFKMICKDGSVLDVLVNLARIRVDDNARSIRVWVIEDSTQQAKPVNNVLNNGASAEVYLDILSHDIKSLTQAITAYSELLLMKPDLSEQYRKYFKTTLQHSRSIFDLISNVKHLSHIKNSDLEVKNIDIFKVLANAIDLVQQNNPHKFLKINQGISESDVIVKCNDMLEYAVLNIINNAIKYENGNEISMDIAHSISEDKRFWKLEFKDYGPGVPDNLKDRIFHDFEIGNEINHGSGLGLALVKEIVIRSGGKVWVEDRIEGDFSQGSNFVLLLPLGA
jgi:PAS domain S-box-containing protein